jgi:hypothetical protein
MSAEITFLAEARLARGGHAPANLAAARRYVAFAEQAIDLVAPIEDAAEQRAVCRIAEIWLTLAETELQRR